MKKNGFGSYNETSPSDSFDEVIDADSNEVKRGPSGSVAKGMRTLLTWAEERRGQKFISYGKQFKAMSMMKNSGISPERIKNRWIEMEGEAYWKKVGIDFMSVLTSFDKKK